MILPNKYISERESLIGVGSVLLINITNEQSLSVLWDSVKKSSNIGSFERFVMALDLLFLLGIIDLKDEKIVKVRK